MAFEQVKIAFQGSFQCRLATDPADKSASPSGPGPAQGWTFRYGEGAFDRRIRLKDPVELRSALVEPFLPTVVSLISVKPEPAFGLEMPWTTVPNDPLLELPVSLGEQAMFDTAAGAGVPGREAVINCRVQLGGLLAVTPRAAPVLAGINRDLAVTAEHAAGKPAAVAAAMASGQMPPERAAALAAFADHYSNVFGFWEDTMPVPVDLEWSPAGAQGILANLFLGWSWTLGLRFARFDGDTLTGRVSGEIAGARGLQG